MLIFRLGGLGDEIRKEAEENCIKTDHYFESYVENIYNEMDHNGDGLIQLNEILRPKSSVWKSFMHFVSVQTLHELQKNAKEKKKKGNRERKSRREKSRDSRTGNDRNSEKNDRVDILIISHSLEKAKRK